ncbi:hypothetical protein GALMADRAFT_262717 [Galerina marginata CBS 339.88]|uniref:MYND-type domain-containing protein n=1 Tax=Galerina marginata (strain CBS 339.88) TaxID=685588 RepID=A0A067TQ95_GALM3|nr:hypothetical protein GALMADRAFT_262717 [Galerina marginata CBS 339.88]
MSTEFVHLFNALSRKKVLPGGLKNLWHFDLRYIQLEPNPSHVVAIIHPESLIFHVEWLPITFPKESGITFFPELPKEAAPEVAKALLHAFAHGFSDHNSSSPNAPLNMAPWRLTTEDKNLASAVGDELKRLGVCPPELCRIGVSTQALNSKMQDRFDGYFHDLIVTVGIPQRVHPYVSIPQSIIFHFQRPSAISDTHVDETDERELGLAYISQIERSRPEMNMVGDFTERFYGRVDGLNTILTEKPTNIVKEVADGGDADAAYEYGVRLLYGFGCKYDRVLARKYLIKSISSPEASNELKCMAHGTLAEWYMSGHHIDTDWELFSRYILAAAHHTNMVALLYRLVSPPGAPPPFPVLSFGTKVFQYCVSEHPEMAYFFANAYKAWEDREAELNIERTRMMEKKMKNQSRYRCAADGCGIETDTGKMLSQCGGKCDMDKKPSYCSKECQKADWKTHKPFCKPGALSSAVKNAPFHSLDGGVIKIPITLPDGTTFLAESSDNDPKTLKELRDRLSKGEEPFAE